MPADRGYFVCVDLRRVADRLARELKRPNIDDDGASQHLSGAAWINEPLDVGSRTVLEPSPFIATEDIDWFYSDFDPVLLLDPGEIVLVRETRRHYPHIKKNGTMLVVMGDRTRAGERRKKRRQ